MNETLKNMDLTTLETYHFEQRHVDYSSIINVSKGKLSIPLFGSRNVKKK